MADKQQLALLRRGSKAWNGWREQNPDVRVNLYMATLSGADLSEANLTGANLREANLLGADLTRADLSRANLSGAELSGAYLSEADLIEANLTGANLTSVDLFKANLLGADLTSATLSGADLTSATLSGADLTSADLIGTNFTGADLTGCRVHGSSAWNLKLEGAKQKNLIITMPGEPEITVDNLEVAQFIYLLLNNERVRHVIDTITSKVVLILGRFTDERKAVLDAIREELRQRDYTPVLFDFDKSASQDLLGTVETLARMARFVIADITEASSVPAELQAIVPHLRTVPVRPLLRTGAPEYALFKSLEKYPWVLKKFKYKDVAKVRSSFDRIISPAERMARKLRGVSPPRGRDTAASLE